MKFLLALGPNRAGLFARSAVRKDTGKISGGVYKSQNL
jgi:hypothetical protein